MSVAKKEKVFFICHIASRSGAPVLLLEIIRAFKKNYEIPFEILIVVSGSLSADFEALGSTHYWNPVTPTTKKSLRSKIKFRLDRWLTERHRKKIIRIANDCSTVFMNTITNGNIQRLLQKKNVVHICYVHEMKAAMKYATNTIDLETVLRNTDKFLACSKSVSDNLVTGHMIPVDKIEVLNTPIQVVSRNTGDYLPFKKEFLERHDIADTTTIVGIVGSNEWRKGFDYFFPLIILYFDLFPDRDVCFIWKGFDPDSELSEFNLFDFEKLKNRDRIKLVPHGIDAIETISCFHIHLLLSREDPYPLVVLESASFGIPTVCFENSGGSVEFIAQESGCSVPYGNLLEMAMALDKLIVGEGLRTMLGQNAKEKLIRQHSAELAMTPFLDLLSGKSEKTKHLSVI